MSVEEMKQAADAAPDVGLQAAIAELARLEIAEYGQQRKAEAKRLGMSVNFLDQAVAEARRAASARQREDEGLELTDPEPWPEPVDGSALVSEIITTLERHCVLPPGAAVAIAFWALHTYCLDAFYVSPFLTLSSPEKRCGKTTLLSLVERMVLRPLLASNITPSAVFRSIEHWHPTLLIDEGDTFLRGDNDELRGILNSGHTRSSAYVIRTVGDDHTPARFSTWAPKVIALIGKLPDTLEDRSVIVPMKRKAPGEKVTKLRLDRLEALSDIPRKCARWAEDSHHAIRAGDPPMPAGLNDRAEDNWRPLMALAVVVGNEWPETLATAIRSITPTDSEPDNLSVELLRDLRAVFHKDGGRHMATISILNALYKIEDSPWDELNRGREMTDRQLAKLLRPYGIKPKKIRIGDITAKGYQAEQFTDSFLRYLPTPSVRGTEEQINKNNVLDENLRGTHKLLVPLENQHNPLNKKKCSSVPFTEGGIREKEENNERNGESPAVLERF